MNQRVLMMTKDDIIKLYEKANGWSPEGWDKTVNELERFANLVASFEREACAKLCDKIADDDGFEGGYAANCADMIRARGQE